MQWCALLTAVKNYNKNLEKLQDFFFNTKTKCLRPRLSFLSSRRLETKTLVSRTTSLGNSEVTDRSVSLPRSLSDLQSCYARDTIFFRLIAALACYVTIDQIRHAITHVHVTRVRFLRGKVRSPTHGAGPTALPDLGDPVTVSRSLTVPNLAALHQTVCVYAGVKICHINGVCRCIKDFELVRFQERSCTGGYSIDIRWSSAAIWRINKDVVICRLLSEQ